MSLMRRWFSAVAAILLMALVQAGPAVATERLAPAAGTLLVAGEEMNDPRFREAVVLLLRCDEGGAIGLILNRPTSLPLGEALPELEGLESGKMPVYYGGPVDSRLLTVLLQSDTPPQDSMPVTGHLYLTGVPQLVGRRSHPDGMEQWRVFAGLSGWSVLQLAGEIERGDWYVVGMDESIIFSDKPQDLWGKLRAKGNEIWI